MGVCRLITIALVLCAPLVFSSEKMYIFNPSLVRSNVIEKMLAESFPDLEITVFRRYPDFLARINTSPPDIILTKSMIISSLEDYKLYKRGQRNGALFEKYALVSINRPIDPDSLDEKTIGTIDLFGRKGTRDFITRSLPSIKKVKLVTKFEDLLPLIRFKMVDAILIPESLVAYFKNSSQLTFSITSVKQLEIDFAAIAVSKSNNAAISLKTVKSLSSIKSDLLGVDRWK